MSWSESGLGGGRVGRPAMLDGEAWVVHEAESRVQQPEPGRRLQVVALTRLLRLLRTAALNGAMGPT